MKDQQRLIWFIWSILSTINIVLLIWLIIRFFFYGKGKNGCTGRESLQAYQVPTTNTDAADSAGEFIGSMPVNSGDHGPELLVTAVDEGNHDLPSGSR